MCGGGIFKKRRSKVKKLLWTTKKSHVAAAGYLKNHFLWMNTAMEKDTVAVAE